MTITAAGARRALVGVVVLCAGIGLFPHVPGSPGLLDEALQARGAGADVAPRGPFVSLPPDKGATTTVADVSGQGNNATLPNRAVWPTWKAAGSSFNGTSAPGLAVSDEIAVMPLGDSLTLGYINDNNPDNEVGGYRRYLWELLQSDGITNVNFVGSLANGIPTIDPDHEGHGGWRVDEIDGAVAGWLAASQPDIILLLAGTNDIIQGYTPALALTRLNALLDKIHTLRPTAKILLANLPGARANPDSIFAAVTPAAVSAFNSGLPAMVSTRAALGWSIVLVDVFGSAGLDRGAASSDYSVDGLHLSLAGYSKVANLWYSALNLGAADAAAPSVPTGVAATTISSARIDLSWTASTDNIGVAGYQVLRNGLAVGSTTGTTFQSTGLVPSTAYAYSVVAYDTASNQSAPSGAASALTASAPQLSGVNSNVAFPAAWNVPVTFTAAATGGAGALQFKFLTYLVGRRVGGRPGLRIQQSVHVVPAARSERGAGVGPRRRVVFGLRRLEVVRHVQRRLRPREAHGARRERRISCVGVDADYVDGISRGRRRAGVQVPALQLHRQRLVGSARLEHEQPGDLDAGRREPRLARPSGLGENCRIERGVRGLAPERLLFRDRPPGDLAHTESDTDRAEGRRHRHVDGDRSGRRPLGVPVHRLRRHVMEGVEGILHRQHLLLVPAGGDVRPAGLGTGRWFGGVLGDVSVHRLFRREPLNASKIL